jgi:hypothetical protein
MAVLQILPEQTELADSDRHGAVFPILPYCLLCLSLVPCREGRAGSWLCEDGHEIRMDCGCAGSSGVEFDPHRPYQHFLF